MTMNSHPRTAMTLAEHVKERVEAQQARSKSDEKIAKEAGFQSQSYIGMVIEGRAKLPLDRVLPMSRALNADSRLLFRLALRQYWEASDAELDELIGGS